MGSRGRNATVVLPTSRPQPPAGLDQRAAAHWRAIVSAVDPGHFVPSDTPLLCEYVQAIVMAEDAHEALTREGAIVNGRPNAWHGVLAQQVKSMVAIAARLRLAPQARFDRTRAGTLARGYAEDEDAAIARLAGGSRA
jgi:phage terminase small subunit